METPAERRALAGFSGEYAVTTGGARVPGHFATPQAEELLVEGTAPTFLARLAELTAQGITRGSRFIAVEALDGRQEGPFRIVFWRAVDDGAFIELGLERVT